MSRLQYASLRAVLGMMKTTSTNVLLDINGELPLKARWSYLTAKFLSKVTARYQHPLNSYLNSMTNISIEERREIKPNAIADIYLSYNHLFNETEKYKLPGSLKFEYQIINYTPNIDTDTGFIISSNKNLFFL